MEVLLNFTWLAIALGGLLLWRKCWAKQGRSSHWHPFWEWTAFICVLVFLFYAVSLTDDLHSELIYFEECAANRRHTTCLACAHHAPPKRVTATHYAIRVIPGFPQRLSAIGSVIPSKEFSPALSRVGVASGRAPPVIVL